MLNIKNHEEKKMNSKYENGTPITAAKHNNRCAKKVLVSNLYYLNAEGKTIITDSNVISTLPAFFAAACEVLSEHGMLIIQGGKKV